MRLGRRFYLVVVLLAAFSPVAAHAGPNASWDGTWVGMLNNAEPVSVTIAGGKVIGYAIRGGQPFGIGYSKITLSTVSFGDNDNYSVKITKIGAAKASGVAHTTMMGDGSATLTRQ
jgi:hypothetical protein